MICSLKNIWLFFHYIHLIPQNWSCSVCLNALFAGTMSCHSGMCIYNSPSNQWHGSLISAAHTVQSDSLLPIVQIKHSWRSHGSLSTDLGCWDTDRNQCIGMCYTNSIHQRDSFNGPACYQTGSDWMQPLWPRRSANTNHNWMLLAFSFSLFVIAMIFSQVKANTRKHRAVVAQ